MKQKISLEEIARQALLERGFLPDFPEAALCQLDAIVKPAMMHKGMRDLRERLWISIDNEDSRDLDQLTFAESDRIYIAVADVDALVKRGTPIDARAAHNTTSVYTPVQVFPMLPLKLSTNLTSLNERENRCAIVIEVQVDPDGRFSLSDLYPALVCNQAKLNYSCIGALLEHAVCKHPFPPVAGLREQLLLQDNIAQRILQYRHRQGALEFGEIKLRPILVNGIPVELGEEGRNRAHQLIENFMIAANVAVTHYLKQKKLPTLRRVVKTPKRWNRIVIVAKECGTKLPPKPDPKALRQFLLEQQSKAPLSFPDLSLTIIKLLGRGEYLLVSPGKSSPGHFDLAEQEYTHATAPNRRFPDLIIQRLLKCALFEEPIPYSNQQLATLAVQCTEKEHQASRIERRLIKCAAAFILQKEIGKKFKAMVTGAGPKGTWVRLQTPPIEGKLTKGLRGLDVGDFLTVKLIRVDVCNGHIDFARESP